MPSSIMLHNTTNGSGVSLAQGDDDGWADWLCVCNCIDFNAVEAVVDATHRYKEIFYDGND